MQKIDFQENCLKCQVCIFVQYNLYQEESSSNTAVDGSKYIPLTMPLLITPI